jgi:hypothetical protein
MLSLLRFTIPWHILFLGARNVSEQWYSTWGTRSPELHEDILLSIHHTTHYTTRCKKYYSVIDTE